MTKNSDRPRSMAADIIDAVREGTKKWTRTVKAEERSPVSRAYRFRRMIRERRVTWTDAMTPALMEKAYLHASGEGKYPAEARQFMYSARGDLNKATGEQLDGLYFTKTLLPKFIADNPKLTANWDIVFAARGHFREPHTGHSFGLGTLEVRQYIASLHDPQLIAAALKQAGIAFRGPSGSFGALLFVEKEGFDPLLSAARIAERFDIATMSTKGTSVTAARMLADEICHNFNIPLLPLRDFDKTGFSISGTLQRDTWRYKLRHRIQVIELSLSLTDVENILTDVENMGLQFEYQHHPKGNKATMIVNLAKNGASEDEIDFMFADFDRLRSTRRVELNAMTSPQFIAFIERKLTKIGIKKIVPDQDKLADAYRLFAHGHVAEPIVRRELERLIGAAVQVPDDIESQVREYLAQHPADHWDEAVRQIAARNRKQQRGEP
jgi:hypothetical protein